TRRPGSGVDRDSRHFRQARGTCRPLNAEGCVMKKLDKKQIAARVARDIPDGAYVNLGIGLPTLVADHLPRGREIILHSENGILGVGPKPAPGEEDEDLINAGKEPATLLPGGACFHRADSSGRISARPADVSIRDACPV